MLETVSDTCEYPMCTRPATVAVRFDSGLERFCKIHADEAVTFSASQENPTGLGRESESSCSFT